VLVDFATRANPGNDDIQTLRLKKDSETFGFQRGHAILHLFVAGLQPTKRFGGIRIVEVTALLGNNEGVVNRALKGKQRPGSARRPWARATIVVGYFGIRVLAAA
jgi:hypothetical protein